ncbi:MAG: nucleotidyltransferase domain-containing protein [Clostridiaceae bacterium]
MLNIGNKISELTAFFKNNPNIISVWIIGSYGTEFQREDSDIDIAILFKTPISLMDEMDISCKISEIIAYEKVDTIDLKMAPITLQFKTLREGKLIYEGDYDKVSDYMEYVFNRYRDEKYYIDSFKKDYFEGYKILKG